MPVPCYCVPKAPHSHREFAESITHRSMERLLYSCEKQLSRVMPLMVTKPSSNSRSPRRWPTATRVLNSSGSHQGGAWDAEWGRGEPGEHDEDVASDLALVETLQKFTLDRESVAILLEVLLLL